MIRTMIVDDQQDVRDLLRMTIELANDGLVVSCEAASGAEALDKLLSCDPSIVVLDEMMPGMNGLETATRIAELRPSQPIILCSAYLDADIARRGEDAGVLAFVHKQDLRTVPDVIRKVLATT